MDRLSNILSKSNDLLTVTESAELLGFTRQNVDYLLREGKIEFVWKGKKRLIYGQWLINYLMESGKLHKSR